ncbi:MAG: DMT family transporter [Thermoguttaceae bacterium]|nr:DMT family transporter [Thermoguttaceae bacterium]MDW8079984.1 DMT family transporter [Thermoguttaceae bacterium]
MSVQETLRRKSGPATGSAVQSEPSTGHVLPPQSRELLGLSFCLMAAVFYTAANISLRYLAGVRTSPATVIFVKELVAVVALLPILLWQWVRGQRVFVSARVVAVLAAIGLAVQLGANLGQQWALGIIGLAVVSPTIFAAMLGSSAILGFLLLAERISWQAIAAVVLVVLAIISLNLSLQQAQSSAPQSAVDEAGLKGSRESPSAQSPGKSPQESPPSGAAQKPDFESQEVYAGWIVLALLTCCGAGIIYSLLGIAIRWARLQGATVESTVFLVTLMGVIGLGPIVYHNALGNSAPLESRLLVFMILSGVANLAGFAAITKGYQMTRVLYANMANATQVAFGALAGVLLFGEAVNFWLILGVALTLAGVLLMGYTATQENNRPASQQPT